MKEYKIVLDDNLSAIYEEIAAVCDKKTEEILQDTLYKVIDLLSRKADKETN